MNTPIRETEQASLISSPSPTPVNCHDPASLSNVSTIPNLMFRYSELLRHSEFVPKSLRHPYLLEVMLKLDDECPKLSITSTSGVKKKISIYQVNFTSVMDIEKQMNVDPPVHEVWQ